jgi:hypothetical protein
LSSPGDSPLFCVFLSRDQSRNSLLNRVGVNSDAPGDDPVGHENELAIDTHILANRISDWRRTSFPHPVFFATFLVFLIYIFIVGRRRRLNLIACRLRVADVTQVQRKWMIAERTKSCHKKEPQAARCLGSSECCLNFKVLGDRAAGGVGGWGCRPSRPYNPKLLVTFLSHIVTLSIVTLSSVKFSIFRPIEGRPLLSEPRGI